MTTLVLPLKCPYFLMPCQVCPDRACEKKQRKHELWLIFKKTYGREPTSEELQTFEDYLRLIGAWK
jgi:hypothetical protein